MVWKTKELKRRGVWACVKREFVGVCQRRTHTMKTPQTLF